MIMKYVRQPHSDRMWSMLCYLFLGTVLFHSMHMIEHIVQELQSDLWGVQDPHGIFGAVADLQWVHFTYVFVVMVATVMVFWGCVAVKGHRWLYAKPGAYLNLWAAILLQGYHQVEHIVKAIQSAQTDFPLTQGLLGHTVGLGFLHHGLSLLVLVPLSAAFISYGFHTEVAALLLRRH